MDNNTTESTELPAFRYAWDWGETGECTAKEQFLLQQRAEQINRKITFMPLGPEQPAPLVRDERTQLIAAKLSAEAETEEVKQRSLELYQQNAKLASQLQLVTVQHKEAQAQAEDARALATAAAADRDRVKVELADLVDELERVKVLVDAPRPVEATLRRDLAAARRNAELVEKELEKERKRSAELEKELGALRKPAPSQ